ncbi:uncharacterized protein LOC111792645 isoform X1 [Cucurbita pepo subsp. pepo]|uniref:uncharacterized protein LOC111792645 isoform X1 n=1 Tax=Cucurbita pepo subsp. pepo TaxID=3664 RepID=UPI000C9D990C|nr:uncharacterized protein LOC111792645 isoform X1 [Cucurbita pepo subsp. pepo]XP_023529955.1 uncharacterized protein LOC111792645 isoform X1 [Cucurbita pepo subsp. pepo]
MENSGGGDDQGSGWFEVKKKHRSSSKFSLQSWVGGFSGKNSSNSSGSPHLVNKNARNDRSKSHPPTSGGSYAVHTQINTEKYISTSTGDDGGPHLSDTVRQDIEVPKSSVLHVIDSHGGSGEYGNVSHKDIPGVAQKIKWGDLEDGSLVLNNSANGVEIKFGNIGEVDLGVSEKNEGKHDLASHISSPDTQVIKLGALSVREEEASHQALLSTDEVKFCQVSHQDFNREFREDLELLSNSEATVCPSTDDSNCKDIGTEHNKLIKDYSSSFNSPSSEEAGTEPKVQKAVELPEPEVENPELHEAAGKSELSSSPLIVQEAELLSTETKEPENSGGSSGPVEDAQIEQGSGTHNVQVVSVPSEGETGESKERFRQRLWCFLFENLNRAVDELYLLCELECDLEQMKEAILVLKEATSDFKDLNARVEEFEEVKRLSSQSVDGMPITMRSDHCRPHALSWEVRRMTNSPHKAEILSSSLEAFKKIRQERANMLEASKNVSGTECPQFMDQMKKTSTVNNILSHAADSALKTTESKGADHTPGNLSGKEKNIESIGTEKVNVVQNGRSRPHSSLSSSINTSKPPLAVKFKREQVESDVEKLLPKRERALAEGMCEKNQKATDNSKRQATVPEKDKEKEKRNMAARKSMDAWKEKRNWEDILSSSVRISSRVSHLPGMARKSAERVRVLHDKLMSPDKKKKTSLDVKREAEEKHARAMKIRSDLENERVQKLQRTSEKLIRVNEWQAVRTMKLREGMYARHQRSESRHEAFLAQVVKRAGDESSKVNEVRFITSLNEENKKIILRQKLHGSELRRAEKLQVMKIKQKEDMAREEAVLERKKLIEAEKLQRLAETQRKKEEAHVRREEERKASSAAREARAMEQLRRKVERARAQQEEAELMAQKLAERLSESEQRRKFYLEQIRERASMDFRDQSSPLLRRIVHKDGQSRSTPNNNGDEQAPSSSDLDSGLAMGKTTMQQHMKRKIKRIRQRLMALKYEFIEPVTGAENIGIGYRTSIGTARAKIGRWLQELQKLRQARKEGAASLGLIIAEMIKYLDGRELELQASRQAGLLDFIASALPASHTSKPEACQVMIHLLKLLRVVLSASANRSYFLGQNLLPPIIPMLSTALENYIKFAASVNAPGNVLPSSKTSIENFESSSEVLDGSLWTITTIIGHVRPEGPQLQMWDSLLELLVAYQVIHRLRDLFALYDRPQVEGSPFPSSILLSIRLLVVLTSRPGTDSTINFMLPASEKLAEDGSEIAISLQSKDFIGTGFTEDDSPSESGLNGVKVVQKQKIAIDKLDDESSEQKKNDGMIPTDGGQRKLTDCSIEANGVNLRTNVQGELQDSEVISKTSVSQGDQKQPMDLVSDQWIKNITKLKPPIAYLLSAISDTGIVGLLSLLTAVLLQANNRLSSEQASYILPSNFEDVATGVLKVLNNLAFLDLKFIQRMLARPDLKMEFFHLMSFLLSHCSSKWTTPSDPIGLLLLESLSILGHFALFHPENQEVLRWGKSPTILHKVCDLPFVFFSDPELMPVLASTLVAACYGCEQNKSVVQQELSMDMLVSLLRSCKNNLPVPAVQSTSAQENDDSNEFNPNGPETRKSLTDGTIRGSRNVCRTTRTSLGRPGGASTGNSNRSNRTRNLRDNRSAKASDEIVSKHNQPTLEVASVLLHYRFPGSFIDRAEQFFSADTPTAFDE